MTNFVTKENEAEPRNSGSALAYLYHGWIGGGLKIIGKSGLG